MKKQKRKNLKIYIFVVAIALCIALMLVLFFLYEKSVENTFRQLIENKLNSYVETQSIEVDSYLNDVTGTIEAVGIMISKSSVNVEGEWLKNYLDALNEAHPHYQVNYVSIEELRAGSTDAEKEDTLKRLENGETTVSDVKFSNRLNGYFFAIAVPVVRGGDIVGAVRCVMNSSVLVQTTQTGEFEDNIHSFVVKSNCEIVPTKEDSQGGNIVEKLVAHGVSEKDADKIRMAINSRAVSSTVMFEYNSKTYYMSVSLLDYNGWKLLGISSFQDMSLYSVGLIRNSVLNNVGLVLCSCLIVVLFFLIYNGQKKKLVDQQLSYSLLEKFTDTLVCEYDYRTDTLRWTSNACKILMLDKDVYECYDERNIINTYAHPEDVEYIRSLRYGYSSPGKIVKSDRKVRILKRNGDYDWFEESYQIVNDKNGNRRLFVAKLDNVTDAFLRETELKQKAETDAMTGLFNGEAMFGLVEKIVEEHHGCLLSFDIDNFKIINDTFGHSAGNAVIVSLGQILRDAEFEDCICGRIGGDEFALFLADCEERRALETAEKLRMRIKSVEHSEFSISNVSVSVGIAFVKRGGDVKLLFERADRAMYEAKRLGKDTVKASENE